jgi:hypothetical protein
VPPGAEHVVHLTCMETTAPTLSGLEPLMSIEELSEYLNVPVRTLYDWRLSGKGPLRAEPARRAARGRPPVVHGDP